MAISSAGVGSGLNVQSIISQLVAVEQQPIRQLQARSSALQTKVSAFGQIKSDLSALQDAAQALVSATTWDSKSFTSNNTSAVTGTATSTALASSFLLNVNNLASGQSIKSGALATGYTAPTTGTLTIELGQWNTNGSFTDGSSDAVTIDVTAGDSLSTIAAAINAKSTAAGVTATVVTAGTTQQLLIRSNTTGASAGFQISASAGLEAFGHKAVENTPGVFTLEGSMTKSQSAADASITIDGVTVTSASNTVANAVPGVSLNLLAATTTPAQITVGVDKEAIKTKIQAFQDAYNKLNTDLKTQTKYDPTSKSGGPLLGDSTVSGLQSMLRSILGATGPAGTTFTRLSDVGLEIQADGSLKTSTAKLDVALQNPANMKTFFATNTGSSTGANGIAKRIYDFAFNANSVGGTVTAHSASFQKRIEQNNKTIEAMNDRIESYQARLVSQYTALDKNMAKLNGLSTYVSSQLAQWNKS